MTRIVATTPTDRQQAQAVLRVRTIALLPALRDELAEYKASMSAAAPDDPVFATASRRPLDIPNIHKRVFAKAVERATTTSSGPATSRCPRD
jgi:hypothetical protein